MPFSSTYSTAETLKMAFACVHQLPVQLSNSQFSLQGQGWSRCTESWIQIWGTSQGTHFWGSPLPHSQGVER